MPTVKEVPFRGNVRFHIVISKTGMQGNYHRVGLIESRPNLPPPRMVRTSHGYSIVRVWEPIVPKQLELAEKQARALVAHVEKCGFSSAWPLVHTGAAAKFGKPIELTEAQKKFYRRDHA